MKRIALITGSGRGIGKAIALALSREGIHVAITFNRSEKEADDLLRQIEKEGSEGACFRLDQGEVPDILRVLTEVRSELGDINIMVNNAAMVQEKPFETITPEDWDHMLAVNLRAPFIFCRETLPVMAKKNWGRVINITSIGGQIGGVNQVHYAASKAGLISLTRSLARIYSKNGVTVNAIAPGLVGTEMIKRQKAYLQAE